MKAIKFFKYGGPDVLELKNITLENLRQGEVLIKNKAIGLNYIDTYHRSGLYPVSLPSHVGMEGSGVVEEIGPNEKIFKKGDRVAYASFPLGSYATHRIFPTENLIRINDELDFEIAATLMTKGITTFFLLNKTYSVKAGETILFHAAAGGVGQVFCQWAKSLGCRIIATVGSDEKIPLAKSYGCDFVINYSKENFSKKVMEITEGKGVSVVYDGVGKKTFEGSVECLKIRGVMISFGNASGPLDPITVSKSIQPKGIYFTRPMGVHYIRTRKELEEAANKVFKMYAQKKINIKIYKKYSLYDVAKAHEDLEARKIIGPAIIIP